MGRGFVKQHGTAACLLVADYTSGQLQAIDTAVLPQGLEG
jgi:hypothetical protein